MLLMLSNAEDRSLVGQLNSIASPVMKEFKDYKRVHENFMKEVKETSIKNKMIKSGEAKDYNIE